MRTVACVLIPHPASQYELTRNPSLAGQPLLIVRADAQGVRPVVLYTSPDLEDLAPGTTLADAQARSPLARQVAADPSAYAQQFDELLARLQLVSPLVEADAPEQAYVGLDGLSALYGGTAGVLAALQAAVPNGLMARIGVGAGKFPAAIAARAAPAGEVRRVPADVASFLAPHPVEALPAPRATPQRLRRLGLRTVGDVARQGIGPLQAQFGPLGAQLWRLAQGEDTQPLVLHRAVEAHTASLSFPAPVATIETMLFAAERLLRQLFARPEMHGRYARIMTVEGAVSQRPRWQRQVALKEPASTVSQAMPAVKRLLTLYPPQGPPEEMTISLQALTGEAGRQTSLFQNVQRAQSLAVALRQVKARFGGVLPVYQIQKAEPWSRIPERRHVLVEYAP